MKAPNKPNGRGDSAALLAPGPWEVRTRINAKRRTAEVTIADANRNDVCEVYGETQSEAECLASLIAAAPDLLEALRQLADWSGPQYSTARALRGFQEQAREAITKAEGRAE
jgi:hypothetical protein